MDQWARFGMRAIFQICIDSTLNNSYNLYIATNNRVKIMNPYAGLSELELRILKLYLAGNEDIDIAEEVQMDEKDVAKIVDKLDGLGFSL